MRRSLRVQLRVLQAYVILTSLTIGALATAAFQRTPAPQNLGEIAVERINVVDRDGTLRMVISNKDRMHPGVMDGKVIDRPRPVAGLLFFNDQGDEVGGLTYSGKATDGQRTADSGIMFDQLKQDQTIGLSYGESNGRRTAALEVWDRSDAPLSELIEKLNAANRITDPAEREAARRAARAGAPPAPRRVFVGKNAERSAVVSLADANGRPRLALTVEATGNPRIEFLDEAGNIVRRVP